MCRPIGRLLFTLLLLGGCDDAPAGVAATKGDVFVVAVGAEEFRVMVSDPARSAEARARLGQSALTGVQGALSRGDGGFNRGFNWHLKPESVTFAALSIELCDALPSAVEQDLEHWLAVVRQYCPWGARVVRME